MIAHIKHVSAKQNMFMGCILNVYGTNCCCCWVASVASDSVRPHRRQPTRLPRPWDSPGKNTGVGCHCLLQCMHACTSVVSDSVQSHEQQPTRLLCPRDSPGKNTDYYYSILLLFCSIGLKNELTVNLEGRSKKLVVGVSIAYFLFHAG